MEGMQAWLCPPSNLPPISSFYRQSRGCSRCGNRSAERLSDGGYPPSEGVR